MAADVIPLHRATLGPNYELVERLQQVGIAPHHVKASNLLDPMLVTHTFETLVSYTTDETTLECLGAANTRQRFRFAIERDCDDVENLGYRPQLAVDPNRSPKSEDILALHVNPRAISRLVEPIVSLARANEIVNPHDPHDPNYGRVVRVAVSSTLALALSYAVFCEFGKFDREFPFEPCVELEAIAEESGITIDESEPPGIWLREVGLRFAGGVSMRYAAELAASEFVKPEEDHENDVFMYRMILRSMAMNMALKSRLTHNRALDQPVSFALEHAYSAKQIGRISNLWFRCSPKLIPNNV